MLTNFEFLNNKFKEIYNEIKTGEIVLYFNTATTLMQCRKVIELGIKFIAKIENVDIENKSLNDIIRDDYLDLDREMFKYVNSIRRMGNEAAHSEVAKFSFEEGISALKITYTFCRYIYENYIRWDEQSIINPFDERLYKDQKMTVVLEKNVEKINEEQIVENMKNISIKPLGVKKDFDKSIITEKDKERLSVWSNDADLVDALKQDFSHWKIFLHPKQNRLIKRSYNGPVLIEGGPGTGKTLVGMYRALELSKTIYPATEGKKILFLTYLKNLVSNIKNDIELIFKNENIKNNVEVNGISLFLLNIAKTKEKNLRYTFDLDKDVEDTAKYFKIEKEILDRHYREALLRRRISEFEEYKEFCLNLEIIETPEYIENTWSALRYLKEKRKNKYDTDEVCSLILGMVLSQEIETYYDSIIVDETQDLSSLQIEVLTKLVKNSKNNLFFLSDPYQKIYNNQDYNDLFSFSFYKRKEILNINYRTTEQIKNFADDFFQEDNEFIKNFKLENLISGNAVRLTKVTKSDYVEKATEKIRKLQNNFKNKEICVITNKKSEIEQIVNKCKKININITRLGDQDTIIDEDAISITTYHGSKGLEFRAVVLLLKENLSVLDNLKEHKKNQCLKYVASTRAREVLEILQID